MNRRFGATTLALWLGAELLLRAAPQLPAPAFRALYGNSLAMFMTVHERLAAAAGEVRVLALGDSLAMTQFQPERFARGVGLPEPAVFNAAYLGMSFPSQDDMLHAIGPGRFTALESALVFVNPRRLSTSETPNTDVLRVGVPPAAGSWRVAWQTKRVGPVLDRVRVYGLSRHLLLSSWRSLLGDPESFDHVEYLGPHGGVAWAHARPSAALPVYPFPPLERVSPERLDELRRVLARLRAAGVRVTLVPSAVHPGLRPFASEEARRSYEAALAEIARETGSAYLPDALAGFALADERDFCDYGHMDAAGGAQYTEHLLALPALRDGR